MNVRIIIRGMRLILSAVLGAAIVAAGQSYPPPFPRPGAVKMLENPRVQVWNVEWPKGQTTALHRHPYDMTGTYYAPGDRLITAVDGSKRPVSTKAGGIIWQRTGLTHIEEGTSDEPLRAVMIELKQDGPEKQVDRLVERGRLRRRRRDAGARQRSRHGLELRAPPACRRAPSPSLPRRGRGVDGRLDAARRLCRARHLACRGNDRLRDRARRSSS